MTIALLRATLIRFISVLLMPSREHLLPLGWLHSELRRRMSTNKSSRYDAKTNIETATHQMHSWIDGTVPIRSHLSDPRLLEGRLLPVYQAMRLGHPSMNRPLSHQEAGIVMCHYPRPRPALLPAVRGRRVWDLEQNQALAECLCCPRRPQREDLVRRH